jgi:hypothetical protein
LRLKLHEYFDGEGRDETMAYTNIFRATKHAEVEPVPIVPRQTPVDTVPRSIFSYAMVRSGLL